MDIPHSASAANPTAPAERQRFRDLLRRVLDGSEEAAQELQTQYGDYIIKAVRRRMPRRLRAKFDSIDFVQDVWVSFFGTPQRDFSTPEHLVAFLMRMAQNKVIDATRERLDGKKRDVGREEPLATVGDAQDAQQVFAREGTPSQTAIGRELWAQLLAGQPPAYRRVLTLLRDGASQTEVAERLKLSRKTVQRILERAMEKTRL
jgi:RNA polymerase sigma-70 factor (ECF subfamily)